RTAMQRADAGSTGAEEMSVFHQLSGGNSGRGPGTAAPSTGTDGGHCASTCENARMPSTKPAITFVILIHMKLLLGLCHWHGTCRIAHRAIPLNTPGEPTIRAVMMGFVIASRASAHSPCRRTDYPSGYDVFRHCDRASAHRS